MERLKNTKIVSVLNNLKTCYEAPGDSLGDDFLKPCLKECNLYKRETAWFRSSVIRVWGDALLNIVNKENAKIEIIAYPQIDKSTKRSLDETLSNKEKDNILKKHREKILLKVLSIDLNSEIHNSETGANIGQMLSYLIADEKLEIRFATCMNYEDYQIVEDNSDEGRLSHVKRGYFNFSDGTTVSFSGSANESHAGLMSQGEAFDVFDSRIENQAWKVIEHVQKIDDTWDGLRNGYKIEKVSRGLLEKIKVFADRNRQTLAQKPGTTKIKNVSEKDSIPDYFWDHKKDAINIFLKNRKGVLEMATGTGKTSTALEIVRQLLIKKEIDKVIICPNIGKTLCYQWEKEIINWKREYNISKFSLSKHFDGHKELQRLLDRPSGILIVNRKPTKLKAVLENCDSQRTLIIQDEVHGFGSEGMKAIQGLHKKFKYTLGLSATPTRKFEDENTEFIFAELGKIIYKFELHQAIEKGILCPFNYYPLKVEFTVEERKKRKNITGLWHASKKGEAPPMTEFEYRNKMASIKKGAENKTYVFADYINKRPHLLQNSIVFCDTKEQAISLGGYIHEHTTRFSFYFDEGVVMENLMRLGSSLDCVLSCHILSEGIDIPCLENIFILASPSDRRETIQRIGRCLRIDKKNTAKVANVIDFICYNDIESDDILSSDKDRMEWLAGDSKGRRKNG